MFYVVECFIYDENSNICYNYETNFYHFIKKPVNIGIKLHDSFDLYMLLMRLETKKQLLTTTLEK